MSDVLDTVLDDLDAEGADLERVLANLPDQDWNRATPAKGWTIAHQVAHLSWTDEIAVTAAVDPMAFRKIIEQAMSDPYGHIDSAAAAGATAPPGLLLQGWKDSRRRLRDTVRLLPAGTKIPWFGPSMSTTSMATARLMETWAHALDVYEALDRVPSPTDRIRHLCYLAFRTRDFAFHLRGLTPSTEPIAIEVISPSGQTWIWGQEDASQRITGSAYHLALLATRRRHRDDLDLVPQGRDADRWMDIMQTFAGPPGDDPVPRACA